MSNGIRIVEMAGAALVSFSLALWLEWLCLRGVMALMPAQSITGTLEAGRVSAPKKLLR